VAFRGDEFLMVYNPERKGWEMPGGKMNIGESTEDAAVREYIEESGYSVSIVSVKRAEGCYVCAAVLGDKVCGGEMTARLFSQLPDELAFLRAEYDGVIEWARSAVRKG
jgi:8-oxo-dGTP diphosphatase